MWESVESESNITEIELDPLPMEPWDPAACETNSSDSQSREDDSGIENRGADGEGDEEEKIEKSYEELMEEVLDENDQESDEEPWTPEMCAKFDENRSKYEWEAVFDAADGQLDVKALHRAVALPIDVAMFEAVGQGQSVEVEQWLLQGADPNHRAGCTNTLPVLTYAAALGLVDIIGILLQYGAEVDAYDGEGWTALHMAADRGHVEAVRRLHTGGANVNARMKVVDKSFSAYYKAEEHGEEDSHSMEEEEGVLHWCANAEDEDVAVDVIDCLCDLGAEVDMRTTTNKTALHWSIDRNNIQIAKRLIKRGADVEARTGFQADTWWTPLTWAARKGSLAMVEMLIDMNADVYGRCQDQRTALWWAEQNCHEEISDLLRKHGIVDRAPIPELHLEVDSD